MALSKVRNRDIIRIFKELAAFLDVEGVAFKPRAFEKVALVVEGMDEELADIYRSGGRKALDALPGVGAGIADRLEELFITGHIKDYDTFKKKYPIDLQGITAVDGVGVKSALRLYKELKVRTRADLERAAQKGKIRSLGGFGDRSEKKILDGIAFLKTSGGRAVLGHILPAIHAIERKLKSLPAVKRLTVCGSVRRMQETVGDIDVLVTSKEPNAVMKFVLSLPEVEHVYAHGEKKTLVRLGVGLDMDVRVVEPESYGAAVQYFTGDKRHNIELRELAVEKGYKLNEYGLFKGLKRIAGGTEDGVYRALGLSFIPPELRTASGELEAARRKKLPNLIPYGSLKGDLQVQTDWTDGSDSIERMARAAKAAGLSYMVVTDHTKSLAMTGGLDEKRIRSQWREIDKVNKRLGSTFTVLKGSEVDVLKDGSLDLDDATLAKLDVVGVAVHSHFSLDRKAQTERIIRAMRNKHVDVVFHPTGRVINRRPPYEVDVDAIINEAERTGTILEVDAYPDRLDLKDEYIRKCVEAGVMLSIDSDAHSASHFPFLELGVAQARRGWASSHDVVNTRTLSEFKKLIT